MKTTFCVFAAILAMGFWRFDPRYLPNPRTERDEVTQPARNAGPGTKVAIVNIPTVIEKYSRAIQIRRDIEDKMFPFKEKAKKIQDEMALIKERLRTGKSSSDDAKRMQSRLRDYQTDLENLETEIKAFVTSPWMIENDDLIWQDINRGIDAIAKAYGFQIVLGHGVSKSTLQLSAYRFPSLRTINLGNTAALYIHGSVDITEALISTIEPNCGPAMNKPSMIKPR